MTKEQLKAGAVFAAIVVGSLGTMAAVNYFKSPERTQAERTRQAIAKTDDDAKRAAVDFAANKPQRIAEALAIGEKTPEVGIKRLAPFKADPDAAAAIEKLESNLRDARIAKARRLIADGVPALAVDELLPYQRNPTPEVQKVLAEAAAVANRQRDAAAKARAAEEKAELAQRRRDGVQIGMSAERVLQSSWGKPERVNRTVRANSVREQWVYPGRHNYLYFENGILTSIQN